MTLVRPAHSELHFAALAPSPLRSWFGVSVSRLLLLSFVDGSVLLCKLVVEHLHLWATVLHLLHIADLVEYSMLHPWQTTIGHPVCCLVGLILISVCVPHFAGQKTLYDLAVFPALACCLHSLLWGEIRFSS